jgi:hypothetical protein
MATRNVTPDFTHVTPQAGKLMDTGNHTVAKAENDQIKANNALRLLNGHK